MMSWIEKQVMTVLLRQESASIKDMRPIDVPANQFSYHLKQLIGQGYIEKRARSDYGLTPAGLQLAGTLSTDTHQQRDNMKTVIILYGRTADGRVCLFEWSRQPYMHQVTLPHDRVGYDNSLEDAIRTACIDKLGKVVDVTYKTNAFIRVTHQQNTVSRMHGLIYQFNPEGITYPQTMRNGRLFLVRSEECRRLMSGMQDFLLKLADTTEPTPFEVELSY